MSEPRCSALKTLSKHAAGLSQNALALRVGVEAPTLVRTLDQLEGQGLVERRPSPRDRRANLVRISQTGRERLAEAEALGDELRLAAMAVFTGDEIMQGLSLLNRLRAQLEAQPAGAGAPAGPSCADA